MAAVRSLPVGLHLLSWLIGVLETWLFLEVLQIPTSLVTGWLSTSTWMALEAGPASRLTAIGSTPAGGGGAGADADGPAHGLLDSREETEARV